MGPEGRQGRCQGTLPPRSFLTSEAGYPQRSHQQGLAPRCARTKPLWVMEALTRLRPRPWQEPAVSPGASPIRLQGRWLREGEAPAPALLGFVGSKFCGRSAPCAVALQGAGASDRRAQGRHPPEAAGAAGTRDGEVPTGSAPAFGVSLCVLGARCPTFSLLGPSLLLRPSTAPGSDSAHALPKAKDLTHRVGSRGSPGPSSPRDMRPRVGGSKGGATTRRNPGWGPETGSHYWRAW